MLPLKAPIRGFLRIPRSYRPLSTSTNGRLVVVKRPWVKTFITSFVVYGIAVHVWASLVLVPLEDEVDSPSLNDSHDFTAEDRTSKNKESSIFIPLGWPRQKPGELYSGSGPEWQKFVQISKNRELIKSLKDELAYLVQQSLSEVSSLKNITGSPLTTRTSWLIPSFPLRAPPTYELHGLKIFQGNVSWVTQPIEAEVGDRLRRVLLPTAAASAFGATIKALMSTQYQNFKVYFPAERRDGADISSIQSSRVISQVDAAGADRPEKRPSPQNDKIGLASSDETTSSDDRSTASHSSRVLSSLQRLPLTGIAHGSAVHVAHSALRQQFFGRRAAPRTSKPGVFYMSGPIAFAGPLGGCRAEVRGEYDPVERKWTEVRVSLIDAHRFKQEPLRP